ncbi:unnamed protein product [Calypogeia fissa]
MKNLLRKLHIGGSNDDQVDAGRIIEGRSFHDGLSLSHSSGRESTGSGGAITSSATSGASPTSLNTSPATSESKPSGLSTVWNAVKSSVEKVNAKEKLSNNAITNAFGELRHRLDSSSDKGDDSPTTPPQRRGTLSPSGSFKRGPSPPDSIKHGSLRGSQRDEVARKDFQLTDEEFQVQMAMALSVSNSYENATAGVVEKAQIEDAKRISLRLCPAVGNSESEAISYRYWATNTVEYEEVIPDGFYDVSGVNSDSHLSGTMPHLLDLQRMPVSQTSKIEVVLVDRENDPNLVALEAKAIELVASAETADTSSFRISLATKIGILVVEHMGGSVSSDKELLLLWRKAGWDNRNASQTVVRNLGSLNIGLTRHRALLFKVLADRVGIPCQLLKGRHYPGVEEEGAVNLVKVDHIREFMIDLMGEPGALVPSEKTATNSSETDMSPKSSKTEHSSSFVSSTQSSPSGSTHSVHSVRSDIVDHSKDRKDPSNLKGGGIPIEGMAPNMKIDYRHHSEPTELQAFESKPVRHIPSRNSSHGRSPSWTEGIGLPGGRQTMDISKDVSQLVLNAAKENPQLLQKLQEVLLESGVVIQEISPKQSQAPVLEDKNVEEENRTVEDRISVPPAPLPKKKGTAVPGRPPIAAFKPPQPVTDEDLHSRDKLQRLDSVEGMGDRRPLESLPTEISSPAAILPSALPAALPLPLPVALPTALPVAVPAALPVAVPVPVPVVTTPINVDVSGGNIQADYIRHVPVAAAAAAAATAAVVASTMVAAAAKGGGADPKMEVPIAAAATATAAVVAATSAVAGRVVGSNESSPVNSDHHPGSGRVEIKVEDIPKGGSMHKQRQSDERSIPGSGRTAPGNSGDGLDGEISAEEERNSENISLQKRYEEVLSDVAEWEIPWEDIIIGERIGLGSYGEVYRGDWHGSEVAVKKFLDQDLSGYALEEFRSEVRIMRRLRHPNVVLFMGAITRPPHLSIVTEFLPRGSLYRLIHRPNNQLDDRRRLRMALDVAKGMNYLHSGNPVIVHRDLKSPNLLVDKNWVVKVCDFGLSRMKHNTFLSSKSTAGTPEWMAPEMLRNEPSNEKCDVYSFGVILWELATLQQPWAGMNPMQVVGAVGFQYRRLDIPPEMEPGLASIIRECWHDNPNLRPSFSQLMAALRPLQRPLSAAQAENSRQGQTSQGLTIQSQPQALPPQPQQEPHAS